MRKRITMILASLFMILGTAWAEEAQTVDYTPTNTGERTKNTGRQITSVNISTEKADVDNTYTLTAEEKTSVYVDKTTEHTMTVIAGETVTATINRAGNWTNAYVYIDLLSDGFTASGATSAEDYAPGDDLMSYSFFSGNEGNDASGYNSEGTTMSKASRNTMTLPAFTAPTTPGTYRMRFKMDWNSIDPAGGTTFVTNGGGIVDVTLEVVGQQIDELIANAEALANAVKAGDGVGTYTEESVNNLRTAIETAKAIEGTPTDEQIAALQSAMKGLVLNMPTPGKFYRLKSNNNSQYLSNTINTTVQTSAATDATTIYYLEAGAEDGQYYLVSYGNGYYLANPWRMGVGSEYINNTEQYKQYVIAEEGNLGCYAFRYGNGSANYLTAAGTATNYTTDKNEDAAQWTIEEVETLPVTIDAEMGYTTFYAPVAVTMPEGLAAHTVVLNGDKAILSTAYNAVPAGAGVVIAGEGGTYELPIVAEAEAIANALSGTLAAAKIQKAENKAYYILSADSDNNAGFNNPMFNETDTEFTANAHSAYLEIAASDDNRQFYAFGTADDIDTAIEHISAPDAAVIYDLLGRRVQNVEKGIYIVNGRKVVIK